MKKFILFLFVTQSIVFSSCSQESTFGPGYQWDLFKNTPDWELAKAVAEEDTAKIYALLKENKIDINLQESKFGRTLLLLAVGNDKEKSTEALLKVGANINLRDSVGDQAIHEAVRFINLKKHSFEILKILLKYRADVNAVSIKGMYSVPIEGAIEDLSCAKLLLNNGANIYYKTVDSNYVVWSDLSSNEFDNLYFAKYLIIEKKMAIPNPILYTLPHNQPRDFNELLNLLIPSSDIKKEKTKKEILNYLHQINFPKNQVYIQSSDTIFKKIQ